MPFRPAIAAAALAMSSVAHAGRIDSVPRAVQSPAPCTRPGAVLPGIETLLLDSVHLVRGKRVALLTNHTGVDRCARRTVDLLVATPGVEVVALFAPEHGLTGTARGGAVIRSGRDSASGVPVVSLYGERQAPTAAMLRDVDVLLYDVQDVGARAYTFVWTMALAMRSAGQAGKPVLVLDRPNPIRADRVGGGLIEPRYRTITGLFPVPIQYGLTPGELARWLVGAGHVKADVGVVPMRGYRRSHWYDETGIPWIAPSPNIRDVETALLYPGLVFFEATNVSEGRGTVMPLRTIGASWLVDAANAARDLNALELPGVRFASTRRAVRGGEKFGGSTIPMIDVVVTDRDLIDPVTVGAHLLRVVHRRHPTRMRYQARGLEELAGSRALREVVAAPGTARQSRARLDTLLRAWSGEAAVFQRGTQPFWLYPP
ncbi:MAG TPA: DUF1343 domain-containing protein [Gemmatimonas sp.]|nr:DUF1343 domain-containing protein [Gemmatimonas sp.]